MQPGLLSAGLVLQDTAPAPWSLHGDAYLLPTFKTAAMRQSDVNPMPGAVHWGGVGAVLLVRYHSTSVGPYSELILTSGLHRVGRHFGFHISQIYVDSLASQKGGQANWAVPKKLAVFDWQQDKQQMLVSIHLPDATEPFLSAGFSLSSIGIPASSVIVPPPFKTILQACDSESSKRQTLATRVSAAGQMHAVTKVKLETNGAEVPSVKHLGVWRTGIALTDFQGKFARPKRLL